MGRPDPIWNGRKRPSDSSESPWGRSFLAEAAALQRTGLAGRRFGSLDRLASAAGLLRDDPEGRERLGEIRVRAVSALALVDLDEIRPFPRPGTVDRDFEQVVSAEPGLFVVRRLVDGRPIRTAPAPDPASFLSTRIFHAAGGRILVMYQTVGSVSLKIWEPGRAAPRDGPSLRKFALAVHPDGRRLYFLAIDGGVGVWDLEERRELRVLPLDFDGNELAVDPGGGRLAVNSLDYTDPRLVVLDTETGRTLGEWTHDVGQGALALSRRRATPRRRRQGEGPQGLRPGRRAGRARIGAPGAQRRGHGRPLRSALSGYLLATSSGDAETVRRGRGLRRTPRRAPPGGRWASRRTTAGWPSATESGRSPTAGFAG